MNGPICATCPRELSKGDRTQRVRRCKTCREADPGRRKDLPMPHAPKRRIPKATSVEPLVGAWWTRPEFQDRSAFQSEARDRHPGGIRSRDVVPRYGARGSARGF